MHQNRGQAHAASRRPSLFSRFAKWASRMTGEPVTFILATLFILGWALTGPLFGFSDTWQLVVNTTTTIITFLMVFLIQNTQNRDSEAIQIKLDELLRADNHAYNALLDLEELEQGDLDELRQHYLRLAERSRQHRTQGDRAAKAPPSVPSPAPDRSGRGTQGPLEVATLPRPSAAGRQRQRRGRAESRKP